MSDDPRNEWIEVGNCAWLHEAEFIRSVLDSAGIESMIPDEQTHGVLPLAPMLGGVRVLVRRSDLDRAKELLTTLPDGE